jgi:hypothetical protein
MYLNFDGTVNLEKQETECIQRAYRASVETMLNLYPLAIPKPMEDRYKDPIPGIPGAELTYKKGILKFTVPELPPHIRADESIQTKLNYHWMDLIVYAHAKSEIDVKLNHAFCLIKIYHKLNVPWDVDNRVFKYIIDGIRYTKIIPDDSSKYLTFMVTGIPKSEEIKTEILVIEYKKVKEKLAEIGLF